VVLDACWTCPGRLLAPALTLRNALNAMSLHQSRNPILATSDAGILQILPDSRYASHAIAVFVELSAAK